MALAEGAAETGCTVHLVDAGIDTGEILRQARVAIVEGDTVETLTAKIHDAEHRIYPEVIAERLAGL
jgi:phosphoribosylglycinamide formyltransferase-1